MFNKVFVFAQRLDFFFFNRLRPFFNSVIVYGNIFNLFESKRFRLKPLTDVTSHGQNRPGRVGLVESPVEQQRNLAGSGRRELSRTRRTYREEVLVHRGSAAAGPAVRRRRSHVSPVRFISILFFSSAPFDAQT